jgi:hypothetical protein
LLQSCCCRQYHPAIFLIYFLLAKFRQKRDLILILFIKKEVIFKSFHSPEVTNNKRVVARFFIFGFSLYSQKYREK